MKNKPFSNPNDFVILTTPYTLNFTNHTANEIPSQQQEAQGALSRSPEKHV